MDTRLIIKPRAMKPSLLKDYLLDDMSSCSSNGFKSFPRRSSSAAAASHCCTTIRFLHEIDAKNKQHKKKLLNLKDGKSRNNGIISKFKSAITALTRFGFTKTENGVFKKNSFLPRSLSKKLMKKGGFSKNKWSTQKEIEEWKVFDQYLNCQLLDQYNSSSTTVATSDQSLQESEFTVPDEYCSSGKKSTSVMVEYELPKEKNDVVGEIKGGIRVGVANGVVSKDRSTTCSDGGDSTNSSSTKKQWSNEEKEQFSPVSVLDCPFDDEDEVSSSSLQHRFARIEGTRKNLMKKIKEFESLASLEPVNLAQRFAEQDNSEIESNESSPLLHSLDTIDKNEYQCQRNVLELLQQMKESISCYGLRVNTDKLILDFFTEKLRDRGLVMKSTCDYYSFDEELLDEAEDWVKGTKRSESFLGLEVQKNREAYVNEMEKHGQWNKRKDLDHHRQENEEMVKDLETGIFVDVLDELLVEFSP